MSQLVEDLRAAKALIEDPEHWTRGTFARDHRGETISYLSDEAVCWCASGAIRRVTEASVSSGARGRYGSRYGAARRLLGEAAKRFEVEDAIAPDLVDVNDDLGHGATMLMFDHAIELAEKEA